MLIIIEGFHCPTTNTLYRMYNKLLLLGDSLTQFGTAPGGWVSRLSCEWVRHVDITNRGLSGYNTGHVLQSIEQILPLEQWDYAVVFLGSNDAEGTTQHVPLPAYRHNLQRIIEVLIERGIKAGNILLLSPPPLADEQFREVFSKTWGIPEHVPLSRSNSVTSQYSQAAVEVSQSMGCECGDMCKIFNTAPCELDSLFTDGLHLSEQGNALVFNKVMAFLLTKLDRSTLPLSDWKSL